MNSKRICDLFFIVCKENDRKKVNLFYALRYNSQHTISLADNRKHLKHHFPKPHEKIYEKILQYVHKKRYIEVLLSEKRTAFLLFTRV
jgi:hypothetical protein